MAGAVEHARGLAVAGRDRVAGRRRPRLAAAGSGVAAGRQLCRRAGEHAMTSARQRRRAKPGAHRGAALLLVLWLVALLTALVGAFRSEERRVGTECVCTC